MRGRAIFRKQVLRHALDTGRGYLLILRELYLPLGFVPLLLESFNLRFIAFCTARFYRVAIAFVS